MLRSYLRLLLFAFGLLVGVQIPAFMDVYTQRLEAHRLESAHSLEASATPRGVSSPATCRRCCGIIAPVTIR